MKSIIMDDRLRELLKIERTKKGKNKSQLSTDIGKANNFISLIESGTIKSIKRNDFKKIWNVLFDLNDDDAEEYIENILNNKTEITEEAIADKTDGLNIYNNDEESIIEEDFLRIKNVIIKAFNVSFKHNPKYTYNSLRLLMANLHFDIGLMLSIFRFPFFLLKDTDFNIRQKLLSEILEIVKRYIDEYAPKKASSEEDI